MYSYVYGVYFYELEMVKMIDDIVKARVLRRLSGKTMKMTFADELKNRMKGIMDEDVVDMREEK
tara:strand:+ start:130 stop:321 length:192 start_codon:yes stop_codon:yes gene_type:complete